MDEGLVGEPLAPSSRQVAPSRDRRWYRGGLHTHHWHSDGSAPLSDLLAAARAQRLDFVAVTEHNTVSHLPLLRDHTAPDLPLIPGVEISTYHGHANVWPIDDFVEFRCRTRCQMAQVRDAVRTRSALFSINHPKDAGPPWEFSDLLSPDCIEVGAARCGSHPTTSLWRPGTGSCAKDDESPQWAAPTNTRGRSRVNRAGTRSALPARGSMPTNSQYPQSWQGIRAGGVSISEGPGGPLIELTAGTGGQQVAVGDEICLPSGASLRLRCRVQRGKGDLLRLISSQETLQVTIDDVDFSHEAQVIASGATYWRAEVIEPPEAALDEEPAALMARALCNPIYVRMA